MKRIKIFSFALGMLLISGCNPSAPTPPPAASSPIPSAALPPAAPVGLISTATAEAPVPAGWVTHTSQQCEYAVSYPPEMQVTGQDPYSRTIAFNLANPEEGARNFIYVSVIPPEIRSMVEHGVYQNDVYNYEPVETEILLSMQVGESKPVRELPNVNSGFTYQRTPDTQLSGYTAQTYENTQPWEFPGGTKEIRYYLPLDGCTYLIGGYMDTSGSDQPGAITEDLFHQVIGTIRLMP